MGIVVAYLLSPVEAVACEEAHVQQHAEDEAVASVTRAVAIEIAADADVGLSGEMNL
jgi:hypothetical protein